MDLNVLPAASEHLGLRRIPACGTPQGRHRRVKVEAIAEPHLHTYPPGVLLNAAQRGPRSNGEVPVHAAECHAERLAHAQTPSSTRGLGEAGVHADEGSAEGLHREDHLGRVLRQTPCAVCEAVREAKDLGPRVHRADLQLPRVHEEDDDDNQQAGSDPNAAAAALAVEVTEPHPFAAVLMVHEAQHGNCRREFYTRQQSRLLLRQQDLHDEVVDVEYEFQGESVHDDIDRPLRHTQQYVAVDEEEHRDHESEQQHGRCDHLPRARQARQGDAGVLLLRDSRGVVRKRLRHQRHQDRPRQTLSSRPSRHVVRRRLPRAREARQGNVDVLILRACSGAVRRRLPQQRRRRQLGLPLRAPRGAHRGARHGLHRPVI
mmetsp:Transcript_145944/g.467887  ORF Transcript_145944/g.467887 Transcript_145944/m.467887 type:complete len:374 (-) Transcript_145944:808-1929(-)